MSICIHNSIESNCYFCNPDVSKELNRLKQENKRLKEVIDAKNDAVTITEILEILDGDDWQASINLIKPVMSEAVKLGLLDKAAPTEIYEDNWKNFTKLIKTFAINAEKNGKDVN